MEVPKAGPSKKELIQDALNQPSTAFLPTATSYDEYSGRCCKRYNIHTQHDDENDAYVFHACDLYGSDGLSFAAQPPQPSLQAPAPQLGRSGQYVGPTEK